MDLNIQAKKAVTREYILRYQTVSKKENKSLLDEFIMLTGYHRKSAVRLLNIKLVKQVILHLDGKLEIGDSGDGHWNGVWKKQ